MITPTAEELIESLKLILHPEGGYYREIYRSETTIENRSVVTSIYFLLQKGQISRWHQVDADEIWHHYAGAPLKLWIMDDGFHTPTLPILSSVNQGGMPTQTVKAYEWQAAESEGEYTLAGCTVAPGFNFDGFRFLPEDQEIKERLTKKHPEIIKYL